MKKIGYFLAILFAFACVSYLTYPSFTLASTQSEQQQSNANLLAQKVFDTYKVKIDTMVKSKKLTLSNKNGFFKSLEKGASVKSSKYDQATNNLARTLFIQKVKTYIDTALSDSKKTNTSNVSSSSKNKTDNSCTDLPNTKKSMTLNEFNNRPLVAAPGYSFEIKNNSATLVYGSNAGNSSSASVSCGGCNGCEKKGVSIPFGGTYYSCEGCSPCNMTIAEDSGGGNNPIKKFVNEIEKNGRSVSNCNDFNLAFPIDSTIKMNSLNSLEITYPSGVAGDKEKKTTTTVSCNCSAGGGVCNPIYSNGNFGCAMINPCTTCSMTATTK